ncbi:MAG: hypothetical protein QOD86_2079 [Miltoncostaeaceae bacterium]|nr:hypothetical protein [Miltoncostaeaceae bacterium]
MSTEAGPGPGGPEQEGPTPEQLMAAFAERLARTPVRDVLLQTMATFSDMAGIRLGLGPFGDGPRDLAQARQAIEALRALLGVAERELGPAQVRPFKEPLAALQMAYARAVEGPPDAPEAGDGPPPPPEGPPPGEDPAERLWTPPGSRR